MQFATLKKHYATIRSWRFEEALFYLMFVGEAIYCSIINCLATALSYGRYYGYIPKTIHWPTLASATLHLTYLCFALIMLNRARHHSAYTNAENITVMALYSLSCLAGVILYGSFTPISYLVGQVLNTIEMLIVN